MDMLAAGPERVTFVIPAGAPEEVAIILDTEAVNGARVREVLLERVGAGNEAKH
jgi:hypothetical protein